MLALAAPAGAQEVEIGEVKVTAEEPDPPPSPGLSTAQTREVDLEEESDVGWITLEDVLESTPSVRVRSFGAPGSPSFLSVRGTDATHTLVMLDGVPLNDAATGFVDLSTVPLALLSTATVVRGGHQSGTGPYHPGGVVLLSSREPEPGVHAGFTLTGGFYPLGPDGGTGDDAGLEARPAGELLRFGAERRLTLFGSSFDGRIGVLAAGSLSTADGDFAFFDDGGTVYDLEDDRFLTRTNNEHTAGSGLLKLSWLPDWSSEVELSGLVHLTRDGLPGIDVLQTERAELARLRSQLGLSYRRWRSDLLDVPFIRADAFVRLTSLELADPLGEISLAAAHALSRDVAGGVTWALHALHPGGTVLGLSGELTVEGWRSVDRLHPGEDGVRALRLNVGFGLSGSAPLWGGKLVAEASARGSLVHDELFDGGRETRPYFSPRAGLKLAPWPFLAVTASVTYTHRPPTFMELFGNGGLFRGNPDLEPERGAGMDLDVTLRLPEDAVAGLALSASATGFVNLLGDQIVFIQNSQRTMVAQNVSSSRIAGLELAARAAYEGWARVDLGYTLMDPVDTSGIEPYDGEMLPNRPRHDLFIETSVFHWGVELTWQADHVSGGFVDRNQKEPISTRTIHSLELTWRPRFAEGLSLDLKWWNVGNEVLDAADIVSAAGVELDRRRAVTDVDGYPLPGTALFFTLSYRR